MAAAPISRRLTCSLAPLALSAALLINAGALTGCQPSPNVEVVRRPSDLERFDRVLPGTQRRAEPTESVSAVAVDPEPAIAPETPGVSMLAARSSSGGTLLDPGQFSFDCADLIMPGDVAEGAERFRVRRRYIDNRPAAVVNMQTSPNFNWGARRMLLDQRDVEPADGVPDGFNALLDNLNFAYERGFRRIVLNRATGELTRSYHEMAEHQQRLYRSVVANWAAAHPDVSLEVYIAINATIEDAPSDRSIACEHVHQLRPWLEAGATIAWLDAINAGNPVRGIGIVEQLNNSPNLIDRSTGRRLIIGGEAMPTDPEDRTEPYGWDRVPLVAASRFGGLRRVGAPDRDLGTDQTFANVWLLGGMGETFEDLVVMHDHGYTPWIAIRASELAVERFRRIYSFGRIECPADWNEDGTVDDRDRTLFRSRWSDRSLRDTFFNGDFDLDGDRDRDDFRKFEQALASGCGAAIDLGPINDDIYGPRMLGAE